MEANDEPSALQIRARKMVSAHRPVVCALTYAGVTGSTDETMRTGLERRRESGKEKTRAEHRGFSVRRYLLLIIWG